MFVQPPLLRSHPSLLEAHSSISVVNNYYRAHNYNIDASVASYCLLTNTSCSYKPISSITCTSESSIRVNTPSVSGVTVMCTSATLIEIYIIIIG